MWQYFIQELNLKEAFLGHREGLEDQIPPEDLLEDFDEPEMRLHNNEADTTGSSTTTTTPSFDE